MLSISVDGAIRRQGIFRCILFSYPRSRIENRKMDSKLRVDLLKCAAVK